MNRYVKSWLKGFTLVELLMTFFLIGVLVVFSLFYIPAQTAKARDAVRKENIGNVGKYIEDYYDDTGCYPSSVPVCGYSLDSGTKTYVSNIPCDPKSKDSYVYVSEISDCPSWFQLYGNLEYTKDSIIDRVGCRDGCGPKCQFNFGTSSSNVRLNPYCKETVPTPSPILTPTPTIVVTPTPTSSPTPTPIPTPTPQNMQYVCAPGGACEVFARPEISGCPDIYINDPTCQNNPCKDKKYRCHDSRGKK